jgi:hypothetical protein
MSDRPLHRRAIKLAFACLGPSRAHWQETWPSLRLERARNGQSGRIILANREIAPLQPLAALSGRIADTVTIVGAGPSMRKVDPGELPGFPILLNGSLSLGLPGALAVEDERFVWRHLPMMEQRLAPGMPRLFSPAVIRLLATRAPRLLAEGSVVLMENLGKRAGELRRRDLPLVSDTPEDGVVVAGTVAFSALQMALGTGARRIAFAGVDLGNADQPRFYETAGSAAASGLSAGLDRILMHFAAAAKLAASRGVALETVTPGSALARVGIPYRRLR